MKTRSFSLFHTVFVACIATLNSCNDEHVEEISCDQYFLSEARTATSIQTIYYDSDGHISAEVGTHNGSISGRGDYSYDANKRLKEVKYAHSGRMEFIYDDSGKLSASLLYDGYRRLDSVVYEYSDSGLLIERSSYGSQNAFPFVDYYVTMEYPDEEIVIVKGYRRETRYQDFINFHVTEYRLDNKKLPFPDAYYTHDLSEGNSVFRHNVVSRKVFHDGVLSNSDNFEYAYNKAGYPLSQRGGNQPVTYTYECQPILE